MWGRARAADDAGGAAGVVIPAGLCGRLGSALALRGVNLVHLRDRAGDDAGEGAFGGKAGAAAVAAEQTTRLLILDEFGYLPFEPAAAYLLFQLVSRRYERGSILITSNCVVSDWGTVLGDHVVATAILDCLLHHSHVLTIRGDSYRLREKRRSGLIKATPVPAQAGAL